MGLRYPETVRKRPIGLDNPLDALESAAYTPEVDFSKDTLAEQAAPTKQVGGSEVGSGNSFDTKSGGVAAGTTLAKGGNAADAASAGLIASGNPYAIGAGLGLMTISSIQKKKQEQKKAEYDAKVAQAEARKSAIDRLSQIGMNLKA